MIFLGDSRCVLSCGGTAFEMSEDHKPDLEGEKVKFLEDLKNLIIRIES